MNKKKMVNDAHKILIKVMTVADLSAVVEIEAKVFRFPWSRKKFQDSLRAGYCCRVIYSSEELVGYGILMDLDSHVVELLNLTIKKSMQDCGFGRRLVDYFICYTNKEKKKAIFLEVRSSNLKAIGLYETVGFKAVAVRKGYYKNDNTSKEDALVMRYTI